MDVARHEALTPMADIAQEVPDGARDEKPGQRIGGNLLANRVEGPAALIGNLVGHVACLRGGPLPDVPSLGAGIPDGALGSLDERLARLCRFACNSSDVVFVCHPVAPLHRAWRQSVLRMHPAPNVKNKGNWRMFRTSRLPGSDPKDTLVARDEPVATDQNSQGGVNTKAPLCLLAGLPGRLVGSIHHEHAERTGQR
jgi:hypothetical protein